MEEDVTDLSQAKRLIIQLSGRVNELTQQLAEQQAREANDFRELQERYGKEKVAHLAAMNRLARLEAERKQQMDLMAAHRVSEWATVAEAALVVALKYGGEQATLEVATLVQQLKAAQRKPS